MARSFQSVQIEHCHTSHLVYSPLTYFRRKYLVTPSLLVQIRLNLSSLHFITITLVSEGTSSSYPEYICTARNRVLCWGFVVENWPFLLPFFFMKPAPDYCVHAIPEHLFFCRFKPHNSHLNSIFVSHAMEQLHYYSFPDPSSFEFIPHSHSFFSETGS